jgi:Flp pilus assembly protein TadG
MKLRAQPVTWRGQVLSEFALVVPLLLVLILGVLEGGVATFSIVSLDHGTREAARYAVLSSSTSAATVRQTLRDNAFLLSVPDANIAITTTSAATGVSCTTDACYAAHASGDYISISATYTYHGLISLVFGPGASFTLSAQSDMRSE